MDEHDRFDLEAFCVAIEHRDAAAQLHFYAPHAVVRLSSLQDPKKAARTLSGGTEIEHWIRQRCAEDDVTYHVTYQWIEADEIMMTEECRRPDATTVLTASTGRVSEGRIISQSVVRILNTPGTPDTPIVN